jgi:diguanylate cyclase (GGDEF)-like protein/PAS domain S-box-containing protein
MRDIFQRIRVALQAIVQAVLGRSRPRVLDPSSAGPQASPASSKLLTYARAHLRVRAVMHAMLVVALALLVGKAMESEKIARLGMTDIEIMNIAAEQSLLTERISMTSALLAMEVGADARRIITLNDTVTRAQAEAQRLDDLLRDHGSLEPQAHAGFRQAYGAWRGIRGRVWLQTQLVVWYANLQDAAGLEQARAGLDKEMYPVRQASDNLLAQARLAALSRSREALDRSHLWTALTLLILLAVTLVVTEIAARSVRRQYLALSGQAAEQVSQHQRMAALLDTLPAGVVVQSTQGRVIDWNLSAASMLGLGHEKPAGGAGLEMDWPAVHEDLSPIPVNERPSMRTLRTGEPVHGEVLGIDVPGAEMRWLTINTELLRDTQGQVSGVVSCFVDITSSRRQQQLLTLAIDGAALGSWEYDIKTGAVRCNDRFLRMLDYPRESLDMTAIAWNALIHPDDLDMWVAAVKNHLLHQDLPPSVEIRFKHRDGRWIWILIRGTVVARQPDGWALSMAGICMDINAQKQLEAQLRDSARTDDLTRMPNRTVVMERVRGMIARSKATPGYNFAVLFMDFDRFKQVNDTLGHGVGDELLRLIAQRLEQSLRPSDAFTQSSDFDPMAARMGGDEFVVVLDDIRGDLDAEIVAGRLVDVLAQPYEIGVHTVNSSVSIGIVTSSHAGDDVETVLRDADIAMYEAKRAGRGRYTMFEPSMHKRARDNVALENDLRQALDKGELFVVYQPLVDLNTGVLAGMEALVRWRHPQRGLVSPVEFIPVAEAAGLIGAVGLFVLKTACAEFARLQHMLGPKGPPSVAVNLSRAQLRQPGLAANVLDVLREFGVAPTQLILEVTESLAAQDHIVQATLHDIKALGVALSLDDFGTGYSSLSCLHELPVNTVKIDRSFVSRAETSDYHRVLIEATIRMAQTLGLGTVAEGIETTEQATLMRTLGCDKGQGYLYSKPLEFQPLVQWISAHSAHSIHHAQV